VKGKGNPFAEPDGGGSPGIALYSSPDLKSWKFESWLAEAVAGGSAGYTPESLVERALPGW